MNSTLSVRGRKVRIFLVEDHHIMRRGLASLLTTEIGAEIVGEAQDGISALEQLQNLLPDAVVMDIAMPRMNGIEATKRIHQRNPKCSILILSMYNSPNLVSQALQAGARGYILKDSMVEELRNALETVLRGDIFISPLIEGFVFENTTTPSIQKDKEQQLTRREYEVLQSLAEGKSVNQIAEELCISIFTVYTHTSNIKLKLNLQSQAEIIRYAVENMLILRDRKI